MGQEGQWKTTRIPFLYTNSTSNRCKTTERNTRRASPKDTLTLTFPQHNFDLAKDSNKAYLGWVFQVQHGRIANGFSRCIFSGTYQIGESGGDIFDGVYEQHLHTLPTPDAERETYRRHMAVTGMHEKSSEGNTNWFSSHTSICSSRRISQQANAHFCISINMDTHCEQWALAFLKALFLSYFLFFLGGGGGMGCVCGGGGGQHSTDMERLTTTTITRWEGRGSWGGEGWCWRGLFLSVRSNIWQEKYN